MKTAKENLRRFTLFLSNQFFRRMPNKSRAILHLNVSADRACASAYSPCYLRRIS